MRDRIVQHPNRYKLTSVSGDIYDLTPEPGIVTEVGTDINKATMLKDTTAALYGLGAESVPDDVFAAINTKINTIEKFYYKIRDIPNTSATGGLSIDLSDIDLDMWREIRIVGVVSSSPASLTYITVNSLSTSSLYSHTLFAPGSGSLLSSTSGIGVVGNRLEPSATAPNTALDISILKVPSPSVKLVIKINLLANETQNYIGISLVDQADINSLDFVLGYPERTVMITDTALWGCKK